jgi:hypothetical protein
MERYVRRFKEMSAFDWAELIKELNKHKEQGHKIYNVSCIAKKV